MFPLSPLHPSDGGFRSYFFVSVIFLCFLPFIFSLSTHTRSHFRSIAIFRLSIEHCLGSFVIENIFFRWYIISSVILFFFLYAFLFFRLQPEPLPTFSSLSLPRPVKLLFFPRGDDPSLVLPFAITFSREFKLKSHAYSLGKNLPIFTRKRDCS